MPIGHAKAASTSTQSFFLVRRLPSAPGAHPSFGHSRGCGREESSSAKSFGVSVRLFGSCGCFVREKLVNRSRILHHEHAALELHGRRELAAILRPLLGDKAEPFEALEVGQRAI